MIVGRKFGRILPELKRFVVVVVVVVCFFYSSLHFCKSKGTREQEPNKGTVAGRPQAGGYSYLYLTNKLKISLSEKSNSLHLYEFEG